jgi:CTP:molybdopterin cytidylyltransferase MocA
MVSGIILAAGDGSRMGTPKALLLYRGMTFAESICLSMRDASINDIILVSGLHSQAIQNMLSPKKICDFAVNPHPSDGMISSLRIGLDHISPNAGAVVVALVDQPFIPAAVFKTIMKAWESSGADIIIPRHIGKRGHPILISRYVWRLCMEGPVSEGLHWVTHHRDVHVSDVDVRSPFVIKDIDSPEDYKNLIMESHD